MSIDNRAFRNAVGILTSDTFHVSFPEDVIDARLWTYPEWNALGLGLVCLSVKYDLDIANLDAWDLSRLDRQDTDLLGRFTAFMERFFTELVNDFASRGGKASGLRQYELPFGHWDTTQGRYIETGENPHGNQ